MSNHEHSIEALLEGVKSNHISIDELKPNSVIMMNWAC